MKTFCYKDRNREISRPVTCKVRAKNSNLIDCYGCPGPSPKVEDQISEKVIKALEKEEPVRRETVFRVKEHRDYLIKKYGYEFYRNVHG